MMSCEPSLPMASANLEVTTARPKGLSPTTLCFLAGLMPCVMPSNADSPCSVISTLPATKGLIFIQRIYGERTRKSDSGERAECGLPGVFQRSASLSGRAGIMAHLRYRLRPRLGRACPPAAQLLWRLRPAHACGECAYVLAAEPARQTCCNAVSRERSGNAARDRQGQCNAASDGERG